MLFRSVGNSFALKFGIKTDNGNYFIDNVKLKERIEISSLTSFDFESGNINDWKKLNEGAGIVITQEDKHGGSYAVKLTASATSKEAWDLQIQSPAITVKQANLYKIVFWAKAVGSGGKIRISTGDKQLMKENGDAGNSDDIRQYLPSLDITGDWQEYVYEIVYDSHLEAVGSALQLSFDMGSIPNKTYYLDDISVTEILKSPNIIISNDTSQNNLFVSNGMLYISNNQIADVKVYDIKGCLLISEQAVSSMNLSSLVQGLYIVKAKIAGENQSLKFIK